jgi:uncharacterized protein (TIGR03066 family)
MRHLLAVSFTCVALTLTGGVVAAADKDKENADKIVGTWEFVKINGKDPGIPIKVEFTKDSKIKVGGMELGSYKIEGDKITLTAKKKDGKDGKDDTDVSTIKLLTEEKMILVDEKKKEETEFKKSK